MLSGRSSKHWFMTIRAFVMVLGYSRKLFVRFTTDMKSPAFLACHEQVFSYFGGLTESCTTT